jgi:hypothetical protein
MTYSTNRCVDSTYLMKVLMLLLAKSKMDEMELGTKKGTLAGAMDEMELGTKKGTLAGAMDEMELISVGLSTNF